MTESIKNFFVRILASPLVGYNNRVKQTYWYKNQFVDGTNYPTDEWCRMHSERDFDVVNLGSSNGAYAFDYSELPVKAFNWALRPQALEYSFKILKNYASILRRGATVIIPLCPFSGLYAVLESPSAYDRYYYVLDPSMQNRFGEVHRRCAYPILFRPLGSLRALRHDEKPRVGHGPFDVCRTPKEYERDARHWLDIWLKQFGIADLEAPLSEENRSKMELRAATLTEIVNFCHKSGLRPALTILPMHRSLARHFSSKFRENYIDAFLRKINITDVPFLDYSSSDDFDTDRYFSNSYFMSPEGAKVFTATILRDLRVI